jgi:hypothetical protein
MQAQKNRTSVRFFCACHHQQKAGEPVPYREAVLNCRVLSLHPMDATVNNTSYRVYALAEMLDGLGPLSTVLLYASTASHAIASTTWLLTLAARWRIPSSNCASSRTTGVRAGVVANAA